ncbi:HD-GYP domain-containing protein [Marinobacterium jannaschii]|uniref:HD-GYP domain-containing protein n=1 Tax=Marinobacterium jannaschii TaxID=64970 RepID=UPI000A039491|nr:HD domain-containing phosphohydrolase [Marinobacterium jannaschii]
MSYKILLVDDEPVNLSLLKSVLQDQYSLFFARSAEEAILRLHQNKPDLILLDIMMPGKDGFALCREIKETPLIGEVPVILVTALSDQGNEERGFASGAVDYISKPIVPALVRARVKTHLALYHRQQELEKAVYERTLELEHSQLAAIRMLGRAAEYKDNETGTHVIRMSYYSKILAAALGWPAREQHLIFQASPMHDIGKIGVPDAILRKPGKLDADEWDVMLEHPIIGARIIDSQFHDLKSSPLLEMARRIALSHHEKWDGSGYPKGLKGEEIPVEGRIVAIADVFDALTSKRPYKDAWSVEDAMALLEEQAGKHFDPGLIELFRNSLPEILAIKERWKDGGDASCDILYDNALTMDSVSE